MMTVKEVSQLTGVSVRTLHYYDSIDLLKPTRVRKSGYRLYDDTALERLQSILLFRELEFPLKDIKKILSSPDFDKDKAIEQQIELLILRREHIENLISLAREMQKTKMNGVKTLDFSAFDTTKIEEYSIQAKKTWGDTDAYKEYEQKAEGKSTEKMTESGKALMQILAEFTGVSNCSPNDERVQALVAKLQNFITDNFYTCTPEILYSLGQMYSDGGSMTENIDNFCGEGTASFVTEAINEYCKR